ncbi:MAG: hypothetical protein N2643_01745 [Endomicrobia bacterium]|nr:hypothetical protein [Endomicrobiia bacterium]
MKSFIKRNFILFIVISLMWLLGLLYLKNRVKNIEKNIVENFVKEVNNIFNTLVLMANQSISIYAEKIFINDEILQILKETQKNQDLVRVKLYEHLLPLYNYYKSKYGNFELHFHTKDGKSLLRFYAPNVFGDD